MLNIQTDECMQARVKAVMNNALIRALLICEFDIVRHWRLMGQNGELELSANGRLSGAHHQKYPTYTHTHTWIRSFDPHNLLAKCAPCASYVHEARR